MATTASRRGNHQSAGSVRRAELIRIAARLFATRGYSSTTVRDIAEEAGILSGSLYHHFDSKEAMLDEILRQFLGDLHDRFVEIAERDSSPRDRLDELVRHSFAVIHETPHAVALYQNEAALLARQPGFEYVGETSRRIEKVWQTVLDEGQAAGEFRADLDMRLSYRFIREAVWATVRWYRPRGRYRHGAVADQYLQILHGGLLA